MKKDKYQFTYNNNIQIKQAINEIVKDNKTTKVNIANILGIAPSNLDKLISKKNINFNDVKRILDTMDCELIIQFKPKNDIDSTDNTFDQKNINPFDELKDIKTKVYELEQFKQYVSNYLKDIETKPINFSGKYHYPNTDVIKTLEQFNHDNIDTSNNNDIEAVEDQTNSKHDNNSKDANNINKQTKPIYATYELGMTSNNGINKWLESNGCIVNPKLYNLKGDCKLKDGFLEILIKYLDNDKMDELINKNIIVKP